MYFVMLLLQKYANYDLSPWTLQKKTLERKLEQTVAEFIWVKIAVSKIPMFENNTWEESDKQKFDKQLFWNSNFVSDKLGHQLIQFSFRSFFGRVQGDKS